MYYNDRDSITTVYQCITSYHPVVDNINAYFRCKVLDEMGDTSDMDERRRYFNDVDADQSEGIDFEEFLEVSEFVLYYVAIM